MSEQPKQLHTGRVQLDARVDPMYALDPQVMGQGAQQLLVQLGTMVVGMIADGRAYSVQLEDMRGKKMPPGQLQVACIVALINPDQAEVGEIARPTHYGAGPILLAQADGSVKQFKWTESGEFWQRIE